MANQITGHLSERTTTSEHWSFSLSSDLITQDEQTRFDADLASLGVDHSIWDGFNAVLQTGTPASKPFAVRAYDGDDLAGLALVYECRKTGEMFFNPPMSTIMDFPGMPMFVWLRYGITVDHFANPGFVAEGVERQEFVEQVTKRLLQTYMLGTVVEYAPAPTFDGAVKFPFVDTGIIDTGDMAGLQEYVGRGKNLSRKLKKFANKGGEVRVIEGPLPHDLRGAALEAFGTLDIMIRTPFQDNYLEMARANLTIDSAALVHFVALLDNEYAGHQSFCLSGERLHCQAGAFDRRRKSTYHAYENIIVKSVEYALKRQLQQIDYGPVLNETKMKMMTGFIPCENRTYVRYRPMSAALPHMIRRSKISPERLGPWTGLGEMSDPAFL